MNEWDDARGMFQMLEGTFGQIGHALQVAEKRRNLQGQAMSAIARGDHKAHRKAVRALIKMSETR